MTSGTVIVKQREEPHVIRTVRCEAESQLDVRKIVAPGCNLSFF